MPVTSWVNCSGTQDTSVFLWWTTGLMLNSGKFRMKKI